MLSRTSRAHRTGARDGVSSRSAPAGDVGDVMFWSAGVVVTAGEDCGPELCLDERTAAATSSRRGSRPVGAKRFWPSIPAGRRRRRTVAPAQVVGGNRALHAETAIGRGQR